MKTIHTLALTATPAMEKVGYSMAETRITILSLVTVIRPLILTALYLKRKMTNEKKCSNLVYY